MIFGGLTSENLNFMELNVLQKAILATIAYYDVLDCSLTGFEVFKYLINPVHIAGQIGLGRNLEIEPIGRISLKDVLDELDGRNLSFYIDQKNGFYFLKNRENLIQIRINRQKLSDEKWKKARKIINWMQVIPLIKLVAMSGSLAMNNAKEESDIDLLIVVKNKRIWTARFLVTLFFQIIGKRRHGSKTKNRFCLNHYITDQSLKINFPSLYNAQTYAHLVLLLEIEKDLYYKFQQGNSWIDDYLAFYNLQKMDNQRKIKINPLLRFVAKIQELILGTFIGLILEKILEFFQKRHIKIHSLKNQKGGRITANNEQLEFHPDSPEGLIIDKYNKSMLRLGFEIQEKDSGLK